MMCLPRTHDIRMRDNRIVLLNIVFAIVMVCLLVATLALPINSSPSGFRLVDVGPAEASLARVGGTDPASFVTQVRTQAPTAGSRLVTARLVTGPDRPAAHLADIIDDLRAAGVENISIVDERAAE